MIPASCFAGARLAAGAFSIVILLGGCASMVPQTMGLRDAWPAGVPERIEHSAVPFFAQDDYQCGPAALATVLANTGAKVTPDELVKDVYLPARQGSLQVEMLAAARRFGLVSYQIAPKYTDLLREVAAGNPVVILQDLGAGVFTNWHYAVVVGYDYPAGELYLRSGKVKREVMPFTMLEYTWRESQYWAMVVMPPGGVPATATEQGYLASIAAMARVGEPRAAIAAYGGYLKRWPDNLPASIALANSYYVLGELGNAEAVLRRAAERNPDSVVVLNNLAQTVSDKGRNEEALVIIEGAIRPDSLFLAEMRGTRALILERLGRKPVNPQ